MTGTEVIDSPAVLRREWAAWDALAVAASRPYGAPGWALSWWSAAAPPGGELRVVTVRAGARLVGLAPFHVTRDRFGIATWALLGDGASSYLEPLAIPAARYDVAAAVAAAVAGTDRTADVVSLGDVARTTPWPRLLSEHWPRRRPRLSAVSSMRAPYLDIGDGGYDAWLGGRSHGFRQQARRLRRELARRDGWIRVAATPAEVTSGLAQLERLHRLRWEPRGGSQALTPPVVAMLRQAGGSMDPARFQVWTAGTGADVFAAGLFVGAGTELHYWLGGFDAAWARWSPSLLLLDEVVRCAAECGYRRVALGPGAGAYKYRFATGEDVLDRVDLLPRGRRYPYVRMCQSPYRLYRVASNRTPPEVKKRIRASAGMVRGHLRAETV